MIQILQKDCMQAYEDTKEYTVKGLYAYAAYENAYKDGVLAT